jgi:hypothetical protein
VQTPQRFRPDQMAEDDPLGNHAAVQYDVINHGKDGIGAVSSRYVRALITQHNICYNVPECKQAFDITSETELPIMPLKVHA